MKRKGFNVVLGLSCLLMMSVSYAKCWKGIDCAEDLPSPAPAPISTTEDWQMIDRYQVKGGLVKDPTTGLMWMRCSFGQTWDGLTCQGKEAAGVKWEQAKVIPKNIDYAGYSDWRLPNKDELKSLVYCSSGKKTKFQAGKHCDGDYTSPTIVQAVFPNTPTTTPFFSYTPTSADYLQWIVIFNVGADFLAMFDEKTDFAIRLVRSGQ